MASLQLCLQTSTLHHWAGIEDGRFSVDKLKELFDNDDNYPSARERIFGTSCLVIDKISMLSRRTSEMVESVCRHVMMNTSALFDKALSHHVNLTKVFKKIKKN